jgi:hypothetical protein
MTMDATKDLLGWMSKQLPRVSLASRSLRWRKLRCIKSNMKRLTIRNLRSSNLESWRKLRKKAVMRLIRIRILNKLSL